MNRVLVIVLLIAGIAGSAFAAGRTDASAEEVTITHYHWTETTYDKINQQAVDIFQAKHPNVTIQMLLLPDSDRAAKIRTALAANGDIDSFALNNGESAEFLQTGQAIEIDPKGFGKNSVQEVVDMWTPGAINAAGGFWGGKYYGIPFELSDYVGWINIADMAAAGLDPKTDIPKTWADFAVVGKALIAESGGVRTRNGYMNNSKEGVFNFLVLLAMMEQLGLDWGTEPGMVASMDNTSALIRGLKTYTDLVTSSGIWDPAVSDNDREGFGNNKTSMFLTGGTWYWGVLDTYSVPREDVQPFPYPRFADGKDIGGVGYGYCVYVSRLAKNPTLTWEWLDTLASQPNEFLKLGYNQPRLTLSDGSQGQDPAIAKESIPYYDEVFKGELAKPAVWLSSTKGAEIQDAVWQAISSVIYQNGKVEDSVSTLQSDIRSILN